MTRTAAHLQRSRGHPPAAETALLFLVTVRTFRVNLRLRGTAGLLGAVGTGILSVLLITLCWRAAADPAQEKVLMLAGAIAVYAFVAYCYALNHAERRLLRGLFGERVLSTGG